LRKLADTVHSEKSVEYDYSTATRTEEEEEKDKYSH
jgi:hypothetical protein